MNTNDIWLNTCEPYKAYIKTVSDLVETDLVQIPQRLYVTEGHEVSSTVEHLAYFNDNGSGEAIASNFSYIRTGLFVDWTAGESISDPSATTYTAPNYGLCVFHMVKNGGTLSLKINGQTTGLSVSNYGTSTSAASSIQIYVSKGDQIQITGGTPSSYTGYFFPMKGVI
jgi:hypothetical protein